MSDPTDGSEFIPELNACYERILKTCDSSVKKKRKGRKPTVNDALRTARAVSRSRLKSTFRFLEECGQPVDEVKRKPAMRAAKKIRGGAAKKGGKQQKI